MNILITGGASGLGAAITKKLASDKDNTVYFTFCKSLEQAKGLESDYSNAKGIKCDFKSAEEVDVLIQKMAELNLAALINNAMIGFEMNHFHKLSSEYFVDNFTRNTIPVIRLTQQAILQFRKAKYGKIITILSSFIEGNPPVGLSEYVASKSYLHSLSRSWAVENSKYNITSNCISPSFMLTTLNKNVDERLIEEKINNHPLKKLLTVEEVADTVSFFIHSSQHINGINLLINAAENVV